MTNMWVPEVNRLPSHRFVSLIETAPGLTRHDAAEYAKTALLAYGRTLAGRNYPTWQEAWNALTDSTPERMGVLTVPHPTCRSCNGRGYSFTGNNIMQSLHRGLPKGTCPECCGSRHTVTLHFPAHYAETTVEHYTV